MDFEGLDGISVGEIRKLCIFFVVGAFSFRFPKKEIPNPVINRHAIKITNFFILNCTKSFLPCLRLCTRSWAKSLCYPVLAIISVNLRGEMKGCQNNLAESEGVDFNSFGFEFQPQEMFPSIPGQINETI